MINYRSISDSFAVVLVTGFCLAPAVRLAAERAGSLTEQQIEVSEAKTAMETLARENNRLKGKLEQSEATLANAQKNLTNAMSEAEEFRRKASELKVRLEALGLEGAGGNIEKLQQRLLRAVSDLKLAEDEEFEAAFSRIPAVMRADVAAVGLTSWNGEAERMRMLDFAKLALAEGNLDAFPPAAAHGAFADCAEESGDPADLVDWALGLPDDPRVIGIYSQSLHGAVRRTFSQLGLGGYDEKREHLKTTLNRVSALPPGLRRDHGIAVLVQEIKWDAEESSFVNPLVESITDSEIRAATHAEFRPEEEE